MAYILAHLFRLASTAIISGLKKTLPKLSNLPIIKSLFYFTEDIP
jgi:hypothetical protein